MQDYKEELMLSLSAMQQLAANSIQKAQAKYNTQYDRQAKETTFRVGDWILVHFPQAAGKSCPDPGMAPTGSLTSLTLISPASKFTTLKMDLSMSISHASLAAQKSSLPAITGTATREGDPDGYQNGWIVYCSLDQLPPPARQ